MRASASSHDLRNEERLAQRDRLLDPHQPEGLPSLKFRQTSVFRHVLERLSDLFVQRGVLEHIRSDSWESSRPSPSVSGWGELV